MRKHKPISPPAFRHPSGKPDRSDKYGVTSCPRRPHDEPLSPGLKRNRRTEAVGFVHEFNRDEYWEV